MSTTLFLFSATQAVLLALAFRAQAALPLRPRGGDPVAQSHSPR